MLGWIAVERIRDGKPTTFGAASGVVAGLVAITPSCGTVNTRGAFVVGVDFTQHAETAYAEGVHGHLPSRRPGAFGTPDALVPRPETAEET
jgi:hypothetical protein